VAPDLAALAQAFGLRHRRVEDADGLAQALDDARAIDSAAGIIEVIIDADASRIVHQAFWRKVADTHSLTHAAK
jgi:thiamine pyrophosphate-dependent acetolactate synthase large subunit-like protein